MAAFPGRSDRRLVGVLSALALVATAACTSSETAPPAAAPTPAAPAGSTLPPMDPGDRATLQARPVPLQVDVVRVVGSPQRKRQVRVVERQVGRTVDAWFDGAYLGGPYPRTNFPKAFAGFSRGAAATARRDKDLLSNAGTARSTLRVVPRKKKVLLDVLAPNRIAVGVTARVRLVFVQERRNGRDRRVTVSGRLLLTRATGGGWKIFGYDVARSAVPTSARGSR